MDSPLRALMNEFQELEGVQFMTDDQKEILFGFLFVTAGIQVSLKCAEIFDRVLIERKDKI